MLSDDPTFREIIMDYRAAIDAEVDDLPAAFSELLRANFYEATGDPRDAGLLEHLPIIRARRAVRLAIAEYEG